MGRAAGVGLECPSCSGFAMKAFGGWRDVGCSSCGMFSVPYFTVFLFFSLFFHHASAYLILFFHFSAFSLLFCFLGVTVFLFSLFFTRILLPLFNSFHTIPLHSCFLYFTTFFFFFSPLFLARQKCNLATLNQHHRWDLMHLFP